MRPFTIYTAEYTGNARNCLYPTEVIVQDIPTLQQAMRRDHVCAKYREDRRSAAGFQWSDCIPMDCDNDHSEDPSNWKQPEDVVAAFPDVAFAVCYSRNHMQEKNGKAARPKFHCYFPVERITDSKVYTAMKQQLRKRFPWFDANAMDAARFYFGTKEPQAKLKLFIEKIIITEEKRVTFCFFNGVEITKEYTNGKSGNKPGWNLKEA